LKAEVAALAKRWSRKPAAGQRGLSAGWPATNRRRRTRDAVCKVGGRSEAPDIGASRVGAKPG
jgi:hypothetical protein